MAQEKLLDLEIVTPQKTIYSGKVISVSVPGSMSPFQILFNHAPIVSSLSPGILRFVNDKDETKYYASSKGFAEVRQNKVSILVETAIEPREIDIEVSRNRLSELKNKLKSLSDMDEIEQLKSTIAEEENNIKAYEKYK